ncbi:MAG TPA: cytochrome c [Kofleriaceae bacterium]|nr:cytochrome c [Kofleriaceae bacterium]
MKKLLKRIAIGFALLLVFGTTAFAVAVVARENRTFEAPYPDIHASGDPTVIARGEYLVRGPAHCVACHGEDLRGGLKFSLPVGTIYARNITPDEATGIGRYSDREIARILRFGVHPTGRAMLPFMPFANLADDDLTAVVSYLRSRSAIHNRVPAHDFNVIGRVAKAFILEPKGPTVTPPKHVEPAVTAEYGEYIANTVANCGGCHTKRDMRTGGAIGVAFAGGQTVESHRTPGVTFVTPNLTPDPATGHITAWSEEMFVARFKNAVDTASPMPWGEFRTLSDGDLRALYRYLRSQPPAKLGQQL